MKKKIKYTLGIIGILLCLGIGCVWGALHFGWFLSPEKRILLAAANTLQGSGWEKMLREAGFMETDGITAELDWKFSAARGIVKFAMGEKENALTVKAGVLGIAAEVDGILSEDTALLQMPLLGDTVYAYPVSADEYQPLLGDLFGSRTAKNIHGALQTMVSVHWNRPGEMQNAGDIVSMIKNMEFEKTEPKTFPVKGNVLCDGFWGHTAYGDVVVYLYRNTLAAVMISGEKYQCEIRFSSGKDQVKLVVSDEEGTRIAFRAEPSESGAEAEIRSAAIRGQDSKLEGTIRVIPGAEYEKLSGDITDISEMPEEKAALLENLAGQIAYLQHLAH